MNRMVKVTLVAESDGKYDLRELLIPLDQYMYVIRDASNVAEHEVIVVDNIN